VTIRLYVLPMERNAEMNSRGPKYLAWSRDPDPSDNVGETAWSIMSYGLHDWGLAAVEADATVHTALAAKADVQQIPADLDNNVGAANRDTVRAFLESVALPGQWVQNGTTWREVVRTVCGMMLFGQRYDGIRQTANPGAAAFGDQIAGNLSVQWGTIPQGIRDAVLETGESFGYDMSFIVGTTLVRAILKSLADLWGDQPVYFGLEPHNGGQTFTV
jgi:hypothetical protein